MTQRGHVIAREVALHRCRLHQATGRWSRPVTGRPDDRCPASRRSAANRCPTPDPRVEQAVDEQPFAAGDRDLADALALRARRIAPACADALLVLADQCGAAERYPRSRSLAN